MITLPLFPRQMIVGHELILLAACGIWFWGDRRIRMTDPAQRARLLLLLNLLPLLSMIVIGIDPQWNFSITHRPIYFGVGPLVERELRHYVMHRPHRNGWPANPDHLLIWLFHVLRLLIRLAGMALALLMGVTEYIWARVGIERLPRRREGEVTVLQAPGWAAFTFGLLRPQIYMTEAVWHSEHCAAVLAHERAHVQRRDPLRRAIAQAGRRLLWYLPFWQRLTDHLDFEAERVCDQLACRMVGRQRYARALMAFTTASHSAQVALHLVSNFAACPKPQDEDTGLLARVRSIDRREQDETPRLFWPVFIGLYLLVLILA